MRIVASRPLLGLAVARQLVALEAEGGPLLRPAARSVSTAPLSVGTRTLPPSTASYSVIGSSSRRLSPSSTLKCGCGAIFHGDHGHRPRLARTGNTPDSSLIRLLSARPAGILTSTSLPGRQDALAAWRR